jgi:hypothetical protein
VERYHLGLVALRGNLSRKKEGTSVDTRSGLLNEEIYSDGVHLAIAQYPDFGRI